MTIEGRKSPKIITADEECQKFLPEKFPELKPAFIKNGTITPANASKLNDGACASGRSQLFTLVLVAEDYANEKGLTPLARIVSFADGENAPVDFSIAPVRAINRALTKAGLKLEDIDYFEINEAFSVVALANIKVRAKTNLAAGAGLGEGECTRRCSGSGASSGCVGCAYRALPDKCATKE